ncbi:MAG: hypothetical protein JWQ32_2068 [Marmoricola sp.]|nr:hypothetical protein [Marmoricola sp.]
MNANGLVVAIAGIWVLCQLFGGDALGRLGIISEPATNPLNLGGSSSNAPSGSGLGGFAGGAGGGAGGGGSF